MRIRILYHHQENKRLQREKALEKRIQQLKREISKIIDTAAEEIVASTTYNFMTVINTEGKSNESSHHLSRQQDLRQ